MKDTQRPYNPNLNNPIDEFTELKQSDIYGFGLFTKKYIPKGMIWWHARPQDVLIISKDQFLTLDSSHETSQMKA